MLVLASSGASAESEAAAVRMLGQRRMDGIIAFLRREDDPETLMALRDFDGALVMFDRAIEVQGDVVLTDHAGGVTRATRHLLDLGHRAIALVGGASSIYPGRERVRGFIEAFEACGVRQPPSSFIRTESLEVDYAFREASSLLFDAAPPTAIIAAGNQVLEGVIAAIEGGGPTVPKGYLSYRLRRLRRRAALGAPHYRRRSRRGADGHDGGADAAGSSAVRRRPPRAKGHSPDAGYAAGILRTPCSRTTHWPSRARSNLCASTSNQRAGLCDRHARIYLVDSRVSVFMESAIRIQDQRLEAGRQCCASVVFLAHYVHRALAGHGDWAASALLSSNAGRVLWCS